MKIRSVTYFCNPGWPIDEKKIQASGMFLVEAKANLEAAGMEVQTTRLATIPFPKLLGADKVGEAAKLAESLSKLLPEYGIDYASLGPALPEVPESYRTLPGAIAASNKVFFTAIMAEPRHGISLPAVNACAEVIVRVAKLEANGFANLNFAALANVPAGIPYFPASYHKGDEPMFSIAMEAADAAVEAFNQAESIEEGRNALVAMIEECSQVLTAIAETLKFKYQVRFGGIDFSLAPFPQAMRSIGTAFERMGVPRVGLHGSMAAVSILTDAIDRAHFPRTGFSTVMLPVMEDARLAERAAEGRLTVKDLLLYSAVCSTGLDTIPLPGDISAGQVAALLLDISALALRLNKPLTARLMPIPGKVAGDLTSFDFGYFANSRVMALKAEPLTSLLSGGEDISINPRHD
jgi:uncharacterized protein (UPF0210 family)